MYPPRWEDLKEATEDPNVTALLEELCHSAALGNPLVETNEALLKLELDQETNMAAARKSLKDVLKDRAGYASGFRRKENIHSFPSSLLNSFLFCRNFQPGRTSLVPAVQGAAGQVRRFPVWIRALRAVRCSKRRCILLPGTHKCVHRAHRDQGQAHPQ